MRPLKGTNQDFNILDYPRDTIFFGKNGILNDKIGSAKNEPGFIVSSINIPYTPIGGIPIEGKIIVISTDDTNSAVGLYDEKTDTYKAILNRNDLGFKKDRPVTGEAKKNFLGEIITVLTDKFSPSYYLNLSRVSNTDPLKTLYLFPINNSPTIELTDVEDTGGNIKTGVYYFSIQHKQSDGTKTNFSKPSLPIRITDDAVLGGIDEYDGSESNLTTSKKILLKVSNVDTSYDKISIAVITKMNGVITSFLLPDIDIVGQSTKDISYDGNEATTDISLGSILTGTANYSTVSSFAQVNGDLYGANVTSEDLINYQKIANNIKVNYTTKLIHPNNFTNALDVDGNITKFASHKINSTPRGFLHDEVYALYISFILEGDGRTPGFHIPGRAMYGGETEASTIASVQGLTAKKFQVEDTSIFKSHTEVLGKGEMGYWENENELYPDVDDFNSTISYDGTPLDGEDLRTKKVRHHKFPSISTCRTRHYPTNINYGVTELDVLGIELENVIIPEEIKDKVQGYEIYYAKRSVDNSTVLGQSLLQWATLDRVNNTEDPTKIWTTGGCFSLMRDDDDAVSGSNQLFANSNYIRFYAFDLLLNKPSINPSYIKNELNLVKTGAQFNDAGNGHYKFLFDFISGTVKDVNSDSKLRSVTNSRYIPANTAVSDINIYNYRAEEFLHLSLNNFFVTTTLNTLKTNDGTNYVTGQSITEDTFLSNVCSLKSNVYNAFPNQELVFTGARQLDLSSTTLTDIYGGDTFVGYYSYSTVGIKSPADRNGELNKFTRRFICECTNNVGLRHEVAPEGKYYPKSTADEVFDSIDKWGGGGEVNTIKYNADYTSVNDLTTVTALDPNEEKINRFPYRIIRADGGNNEGRDASYWKSFKANNYFESIQNKAEIINISPFGNDRLLIHHRNGLFITKGSAKLSTDIVEIVLGSGDIFEHKPDEVAPSKEGTLGTQHQLSCLYTKYGYFFVDAEVGKVYLYNGRGQDLTNGLSMLLRDNLNVTEDNPFTGSGITVGFDEKFDRILLTVKNTTYNYTVSYYPLQQSWGFFHDYVPDFLINTRVNLFSFKTQNNVSKLFIHNKGEYGVFYNAIEDSPTPYPFIVDIPFIAPKNSKGKTVPVILSSVSWVTEVMNNGVPIFGETFDYASIRNAYQGSGKILLTKNLLFAANNHNNRNISNGWNFNQFRDIVRNRGEKFTEDILNGFEFIEANLNNNLAWFHRKRFEDKYFIVRLEYSNSENKELYLYEVTAESRQSFR